MGHPKKIFLIDCNFVHLGYYVHLGYVRFKGGAPVKLSGMYEGHRILELFLYYKLRPITAYNLNVLHSLLLCNASVISSPRLVISLQ